MDSNIASAHIYNEMVIKDEAKILSIGLLPEDTQSHLPLRVMLIALALETQSLFSTRNP